MSHELFCIQLNQILKAFNKSILHISCTYIQTNNFVRTCMARLFHIIEYTGIARPVFLKVRGEYKK